MRIKGLNFVEIVNVPALTVADTVYNYSSHSLGDGLWSIEAQETPDPWGPCIREWVGSNGTRYDEEADDLWEEVRQWEQDPNGGGKILREAYSYKKYEAPDGVRGSYSFFLKEIENGNLHGLLLCF